MARAELEERSVDKPSALMTRKRQQHRGSSRSTNADRPVVPKMQPAGSARSESPSASVDGHVRPG